MVERKLYPLRPVSILKQRIHSFRAQHGTSLSCSEKGAVLLEFSICISILIVLVFGVAASSIMIQERTDIVQIARASARAGANRSLGGTPLTRAQTVANTSFRANGIDLNRYQVNVQTIEVQGKQAVRVNIVPRTDNMGMLVGYLLRTSRSSATFVLS